MDTSVACARPEPTVTAVVDGQLHVARATGGGHSGGACDPDPRAAARRALGEYAERHSHSHAANLLPILAEPGPRATVAPSALLATVPDRPHHWIAGLGLPDGAPVAVPAQAVLLGWDPPPPERRWWVQTSVGTAAGATPDDARAAALREVVERHVLTHGWRTGDIRFEELGDLHESLLPAGLLAAFARHGVTVRTVRVAGVRPDVVLAMLFRADGEALTCGAAARGHTGDAVVHAVCEAVATRLALRSPGPPRDLDHARGLAVAAAGPRHLSFVDERVVGDGTPRATPADLPALLATAERMFLAQPVAIELPPVGDLVVHRVICPGAAVFEPLTQPAGLTCPIA